MHSLKKYGVADKNYTSAEEAKGDTYTQVDGSFPPTNLACKDNPFKDELEKVKYILDLGCGVGRNLPWILENTSAVYVGLDPNTYMTDYFWEVQASRGFGKDVWGDRVLLYNEFSEIPDTIRFDYVVSTFVLQHLGYRYTVPNGLNITGITKEVRARSNPGAVWFALEHDSEEDWIPTWVNECGLNFETYIRGYKGLPELSERDHTAPNGGHHLIIFKL